MRRTISQAVFLLGLVAANLAMASRLSAAPSKATYWSKCTWICTAQHTAAQACEDAYFSDCGQDEFCPTKPDCQQNPT